MLQSPGTVSQTHESTEQAAISPRARRIATRGVENESLSHARAHTHTLSLSLSLPPSLRLSLSPSLSRARSPNIYKYARRSLGEGEEGSSYGAQAQL